MDYSIKGLQRILGADKIKPDGDYLITTHNEAGTKVGQGTHVVVGEVPDSSLNEKSTMVVLERLPAPPPPPSTAPKPRRKTSTKPLQRLN